MLDIIEYFCFVLELCLAGLGVSSILKLESNSAFLTLSPILTYGLLSWLLSFLVYLNIPITQSAPYAAMLGTLLALAGVFRLKSHWKPILAAFLAAIVPIALFSKGLSVGLHNFYNAPYPDGWSYIAFAQTILDHPISVRSGLGVLYQYAVHLFDTRYANISVLDFIVWQFRLEHASDAWTSMQMLGIWMSWLSLSFLALLFNLSGVWRYLFPFAVSLSGWGLLTARINSFDNQMALPFIWTTLGAVLAPQRALTNYLVAGFSCGFVLVAYPEMGFVTLIITFPILFLDSASSFIKNRHAPLLCEEKLHLPAFLLTATLPGLYKLNRIIGFFLAQFAVSNTARPGGGMFPELTRWKSYAASLFLSPTNPSPLHVLFAVAGIVFGLAALVTFTLRGQKVALRFSPLLILLAASLHYGIGQEYGYAAQKFLLILFPLLILFITLAFQKRAVSNFLSYAFVLFLCIIPIQGTRKFLEDSKDLSRVLSESKALSRIEDLTHGAPFGIYVNDDHETLWAVYFTRTAPVRLLHPTLYLAQPHVLAVLAQGTQYPKESISTFLLDRTSALATANLPRKLLWSDSIYSLYSFSDPSKLRF